MTREDAAAIIRNALAAEPQIAGILSADAFAQRLAISLDALGLLTLATSNTPFEKPSGEHAANTQHPSRSPQDQPTEWATKRNRV